MHHLPVNLSCKNKQQHRFISRIGHSEFTPGISVFRGNLSVEMAGKSGKHRRPENSSAEMQKNISINTPLISFDKPKKSKEKSDDEGNHYKKSKIPLNLGKRSPKLSKRRYVYLGILICHQKRG